MTPPEPDDEKHQVAPEAFIVGKTLSSAEGQSAEFMFMGAKILQTLEAQAQQTEKAIIRQGAEESSCKQVCCQIKDPARSHQAGQDSVRLSSDIEIQQLDPRAIQKQIAAMKILEVF
ncbi:hypothetical protein NDU88_007379 [Pleurodeles waltl]|uniref:Uncharacterized protein n=1 Tax=Pleurodeles waltl TaxID=8319 RepID=A0AAV7QKG5_PLEWA|nr:hypothetical protein NDU88_007379 [Pleurodeles waltl]